MTDTKRPVSPGAEELIGKYIPVFGEDSGNFVVLQDYMGNDLSIESAARLSYGGGGTRKINETRGLIRYLRRHLHSSPSEMCELRFHICMPIFVMRQWVRHRTANLNEISGRYSLLPMIFYTPAADKFEYQSKLNKQGRADVVEEEKYKAAVERWNKLRKDSSQLYEDLTGDEISREIARIDLSLSTLTQVIWKIDLHNLFHFLNLRTDNHAQYEIRAFANIIAGMVKMAFPLSFEGWVDYSKGSTNMSRMEMNALIDYVYHKRDINHAMDMTQFEKQYGFSKRESIEFFEKLKPKEIPNYDLDLSTAKTSEYYEELLNSKVPKIDLK